MKDLIMEHGYLIASSLYPTWFRWKTFFKDQSFRKKSLYIPHGSDERGDALRMCTSYKLYIPHGSDESQHIV